MRAPTSDSESGSRVGRGDIRELPSDLRRLLGAPKRLSAQRLWRALRDDEKSATLRAHISHREARAELVQLVAEARNFRRKTVNNWDDAKIVSAARLLRFSNPLSASLLRLMHVERRREMLARFLDSLGIPNDDGIVEEVEEGNRGRRLEVQEVDVHAAADDLARDHGLRQVVVYFLTLSIMGEPLADHLWSWFQALPDEAAADPGEEPETSAPDDVNLDLEADSERDPSSEGDPSAKGDSDRYSSFTTLDRLLIEAVVDSKQEVVGSLNEDEVDDAVDEFVKLNGRRQHSYFHLGFRDVLFDGSPREQVPAENPKRARWYWAGAVLGWARSESWSQIVEAYDDQPAVRDLGDGADFATEQAARHVVLALWRCDRSSEVASFIRVRALLRSPVLFMEMLDIGTKLLRCGEEGQARTILDRLMEAVRAWEREGQAPAFQPFLNVRRRRAHCLQRALEHDRARRLLERLLDLDSDPNHRAMVQADLGLLAGKFNSLEDVCLPSDRNGLRDLLDRLREGRAHFEAAVADDVPYAAHGHYCLGVLSLGENVLNGGERSYREAEDHLLRAHSRFGGRPRDYGEALVSRTNLYFGIARAARAESAGTLSHSANVMVRALEQGASFPPYLVDEVVEGLDLGAGAEELRRFARTLLESGDDSGLNALAKSAIAVERCEEVTDGLRQRAERSGKSEAAAQDLRVCLAGYLKAGRTDDARDVLDQLETLAAFGIGTEQFVELLSDKHYQPAWEPEEATIAHARCLEAEGRYLDALRLLRELVHRYAGEGGLHDAEGLLARIRSYGLPEDHYASEVGRVNALLTKSQAEDLHGAGAEAEKAPVPVRVLFVGGAEQQAKMENAIRDQLKQRAPHIAVKFVFPGWSGNWRRQLDKVKGELPKHDALVIMRFIRTEFGKQVRKHCDKPWRFCWPSGTKAMTDSILAAAKAARPVD